MDRDEILRESRSENQDKDLYTIDVMSKSQRIGGLAAVCAAFALMIIESFVLDNTNYGYCLIVCAGGAFSSAYRYLRTKQRKCLALAVICGVGIVCAVVFYSMNLAK